MVQAQCLIDIVLANRGHAAERAHRAGRRIRSEPAEQNRIRQLVLFGQAVIDADRFAVGAFRDGNVLCQVDARSCGSASRQVRQRIELAKPCGNRVQAIGGNDVVRKWRAAERIGNRRKTAKIALAHGRRGHLLRTRLRLPPPKSFVVEEEERSVLAVVNLRNEDRSRHVAAEFVAIVLRQGKLRRKEVLGRQLAIAIELQQREMQLIAASLGDRDNLVRLAELRGCAGGNHFEFLNAVKRRPFAQAALDPGLRVADAIERECNRAGVRRAGDRRSDAVVRAHVLAAGVLDAGGQQHESSDAQPAVQRDAGDRLVIDYPSNGGFFGRDQRGLRRHLDSLRRLADLQLHLEIGALIDLQHDAGLLVTLETGLRHRQPVFARTQQGKQILAARAAGHGAGEVGFHVGYLDRRAGDACAGCV